MKSRIVSLGHYVPPKIVTNKDLEKLMDTSDDWIVQRSGIHERRWVSPGETTLSMAHSASLEALERAKVSADEIDAIVFAALISDYVFPGTGVLLQKSLGCKRTIPALDIRNQCTGFLYALSVADAWIRAGMYKKILIVCSEIHSTSLDISTRGRDVSVLFGDGAGACLLEACDDQSSSYIQDILIASQGEYAEKLYLRAPSPNDSPRLSPQLFETPDIYPHMEGKLVFKNAVERMTESMLAVLQRNKLRTTEVDFVIAHQANLRINQMVLEQLKIPLAKTHNTIDRYGNTTAATIPLTMNEAVEKNLIKRGDLVAMTAFGSGFTWGSALVRF